MERETQCVCVCVCVCVCTMYSRKLDSQATFDIAMRRSPFVGSAMAVDSGQSRLAGIEALAYRFLASSPPETC